MIASDDNNPAFAGAINPDSRLAVRFYSKPVKNEYETSAQGRPIFFDMDYVEIQSPGDTLSIIDTPAREDHKRRFPLHWAHYQNKHGTDSRGIGTPIEHWPLVTASQAEELKALKFYTVDAVAGASDQQLQRIGMIAGMSPYAFRDRAVNFLRVAKDESSLNSAEARIKEIEEKSAKDRAESDAKIAEMQEQMRGLLNAQAEKKMGRPPKEREAA